jgi:ribosomal silencing factor RsfS
VSDKSERIDALVFVTLSNEVRIQDILEKIREALAGYMRRKTTSRATSNSRCQLSVLGGTQSLNLLG